MSNIWEKMTEKEQVMVKGTGGNPCNDGLQKAVAKFLVPSKYGAGSCEPAYKISNILEGVPTKESNCSQIGGGCTLRTVCK